MTYKFSVAELQFFREIVGTYMDVIRKLTNDSFVRTADILSEIVGADEVLTYFNSLLCRNLTRNVIITDVAALSSAPFERQKPS